MADTGRPPVYKTVEEMQEKIDAYLNNTDEDKLTLTGLALALGFASRQSIYDYEKRDEFSYIIKRARLKVEHSYEVDLRENGGSGNIFALKNFGWTDKQSLEHTTIDDAGATVGIPIRFE